MPSLLHSGKPAQPVFFCLKREGLNIPAEMLFPFFLLKLLLSLFNRILHVISRSAAGAEIPVFFVFIDLIFPDRVDVAALPALPEIEMIIEAGLVVEMIKAIVAIPFDAGKSLFKIISGIVLLILFGKEKIPQLINQ